jgi:hypothetical protein
MHDNIVYFSVKVYMYDQDLEIYITENTDD